MTSIKNQQLRSQGLGSEHLASDGPAADVSDDAMGRRAAMVAPTAAVTGALLFLLGVLLHPGRDGASIAAAGDFYGITHGIEAIGLVLVAIGLLAYCAPAAVRLGSAGLVAFLTAVAGTVFWFGLLVLDGTRNPVTARYAPAIVHTPADLDPGALIVFLPALIIFPIGYALLARVLVRNNLSWPGRLIGVGAVLYWSGSIPLLAVGPRSPATAILETAGALLYTVGFVLLARSWPTAMSPTPVPPPGKAFH
jgi:hypothetical protein